MTEPRRKCPRCGKRRTMQTAILWRRRVEDELRPVCGSCWVDLQLSIVAFNEALMTPGMRLTLVPSDDDQTHNTPCPFGEPGMMGG